MNPPDTEPGAAGDRPADSCDTPAPLPASGSRSRADPDLLLDAHLYRELLETSQILICIHTLDGRIVSVNEQTVAKLGYPRGQIEGKSIADLLAPGVKSRFKDYLGDIERQGRAHGIMRVVTAKGEERLLEYHNTLRRLPGSPPLICGISFDVTEAKRTETELKVQKAYFQQLFDHSPLGIVLLDEDDRVVDANSSFEAIFQYRVGQIRGRLINDLIVPDGLSDEASQMSRHVIRRGEVEKQTVRMRRDGTLVHVSVMGRTILLESERLGVYGIYRDISDKIQADRRIQALAFYDTLTGLPNRERFNERLDGAVNTARASGKSLALLFVDLDEFKRINDVFGHSVGDEFIREFSRRLLRAVRLSDFVARSEADHPSISRLGGDEFTVLLQDVPNPQDATLVARRILNALVEPIRLGERQVYTTASIGISIFPGDGDDGEELLKAADTAMYNAKKHGRNQYRFFTRALNDAAVRRLAVEDRLRQAIREGALSIHYQAVFDARTGRVVAAEALSRWEDPVLGVIEPTEFISIAEDTHLIEAMDRAVLEKGCLELHGWLESGYAPVRLMVNLSSKRLGNGELLECIDAALQKSGLAPDLLEVEVTERVLFADGGPGLEMLTEIKKLGVGLALDDFGTGYSSLSQLMRLPLDRLKLDRSFVTDVATKKRHRALVGAVISLAHAVGLKVVGEGVETPGQATILGECGCDELQGFHLSRPMPADQFASVLEMSGESASKSVLSGG